MPTRVPTVCHRDTKLLQGYEWENATLRNKIGLVNASLDYSLSFQLKVRSPSVSSQWHAIIHVGDYDAQRMPALWWKGNGAAVHYLVRF